MAPLTLWHIYLLSWKLVPQQSKWDLGKNFFYILKSTKCPYHLRQKKFTHLKWEAFQTKWETKVFMYQCYKEAFQITF